MNFNIETRIRKYIDTIQSIEEGNRNKGLRNIGLCLRSNFGLSGDALEAILQEVNQTKCTTPLSASEVRTIAQSVDRANVPLGDSDTSYAGHRVRRASIPKQQVEYSVSLSDTSIPVADLLSKTVSVYPHCQTRTPNGTTTIGQFLDDCKEGKYRAQVEKIRAEPNKEQRNKLKAELLPAIVPNANPQKERNNAACEGAGRSGSVQIDLDGIPAEELPSAIKAIVALPYALAIGLSASGTGLFVLIACEGAPDLKKLIAALQDDFPCKIDTSRSDLCGLRFGTFDENLLIKSGEVFPVILAEQTVSVYDVDDNEPLPSAGQPAHTNHSATASWCPLPLEPFPEKTRRFIQEAAKAIGVDPACIAFPILSVYSGIVGRCCQIELKRGYTEILSIWMALVSPSGTRKTAAVQAVQAPVLEYQRKADADFERQQAEYEEELAEYNRKENSDMEFQSEPISPIAEQFLLDDTTTEAVAEIFESNPNGCLFVQDELSSWLASFDAYRAGGKDLPFWLKTFNGIPIRVNRKGKSKKKFISASTPAVAICGGIQPGVIRKKLAANPDFFDSGLIARFLFVNPPEKFAGWLEEEVSLVTEQGYRQVIDNLFEMRKVGHHTPDNPLVLTLSPEAKAVWAPFYNRNEAEKLTISSDSGRATWAKLPGYAARIAAVLHVAEHLELLNQYILVPTVVPGKTMARAIELVEWLKNESLRILSSFHSQPINVDRESAAILGAIKANGATTKADLLRLQIFKKAAHPSELIDANIVKLRRRGLIESEFEKSPNGGRGKEVFRFPTSGRGSGTIENPDEFGGSTSTSSESLRTNVSATQSGIEMGAGGGTIENLDEFWGCTSTSSAEETVDKVVLAGDGQTMVNNDSNERVARCGSGTVENSDEFEGSTFNEVTDKAGGGQAPVKTSGVGDYLESMRLAGAGNRDTPI